MISDELIKKLGLLPTKDTIGVSFINKARLFTWPAVTDLSATIFVMECDLEGSLMPEGKVMILQRWRMAFKHIVLSLDDIKGLNHRQIAGVVHTKLTRKRAIKHDWRTAKSR